MLDGVERHGLEPGLDRRLTGGDHLRVLHRAAVLGRADVDRPSLEAHVGDVLDGPAARILRNTARRLLDRLRERLPHLDQVIALLGAGLLRARIVAGERPCFAERGLTLVDRRGGASRAEPRWRSDRRPRRLRRPRPRSTRREDAATSTGGWRRARARGSARRSSAGAPAGRRIRRADWSSSAMSSEARKAAPTRAKDVASTGQTTAEAWAWVPRPRAWAGCRCRTTVAGAAWAMNPPWRGGVGRAQVGSMSARTFMPGS